jgi:hypothetical protein
MKKNLVAMTFASPASMLVLAPLPASAWCILGFIGDTCGAPPSGGRGATRPVPGPSLAPVCRSSQSATAPTGSCGAIGASLTGLPCRQPRGARKAPSIPSAVTDSQTNSVSSLSRAMSLHIAARCEYSRLRSGSSCCSAISAHSAARFRHSSANRVLIGNARTDHSYVFANEWSKQAFPRTILCVASRSPDLFNDSVPTVRSCL